MLKPRGKTIGSVVGVLCAILLAGSGCLNRQTKDDPLVPSEDRPLYKVPAEQRGRVVKLRQYALFGSLWL